MAAEAPNISCVSLGMVIIDEIRMPNKPILKDVIGGSATFVTLGQRLFAKFKSQVGCLVLAGNDLPEDVEKAIRGWGTTLELKKREERLSTRGQLEYEDDTYGTKKFTYTTEPIRAVPTDLIKTPLLYAKAFHLFGTPEEVMIQVPELLHLREINYIIPRPLIVWEPLPASCVPSNRQLFLDACKFVDVFSPNHIELEKIFVEKVSETFQCNQLELYSHQILDSSIGPDGDGFIIVRAGENGALSMSRASRPTWLPAYYDKNAREIVDPTGAGNTFLGGYIAGWQRTDDANEAMFYGQVAASFALEQISLPKAEIIGGKTLWNGVEALDRLAEYKERLKRARVMSEHMV